MQGGPALATSGVVTKGREVTRSGLFTRRPRRPSMASVLVLLSVLGLAALATGDATRTTATVAASPTWQWYKTDPHVHSVTGGDGFDDYGIISRAAKDRGYDALFLTDHQGGSSFEIGAWTANSLVFDETYSKWSSKTSGSLSASTNGLASTQVHSGTKSLHLKSSSNTSGETFVVS